MVKKVFLLYPTKIPKYDRNHRYGKYFGLVNSILNFIIFDVFFLHVTDFIGTTLKNVMKNMSYFLYNYNLDRGIYTQ